MVSTVFARKERVEATGSCERQDYRSRRRERDGLIEGAYRGGKLSLADTIKLLDPKATEQRRLFIRLFEGPLTPRTARGVFNEDSFSSLIGRINRRFQNHFGKDAILKISPWRIPPGDRAFVRGFWILMPNLEIFDVPPKAILQPGRDVRIADLLWVLERRILFYVAEHPLCSQEELRKHFSKSAVIRFRTNRKQSNLHPDVELPFPPPLLKTKTEPHLYWVNPELVSYSFSTPASKETRGVEELFGSKDREFLYGLARYEAAVLAALRQEGEQGTYNIWYRSVRINERCRELNWPEAIVRIDPEGRRMKIAMTAAFRKRAGLPEAKTEPLHNHFSPAQMRMILYLVEHPLSTSREMARALGVSASAVSSHFSGIAAACKKLGFPPIQQIPGTYIYYLPADMLKFFGLPVRPWNPEKLFHGSIQRRVYRYLLQYPDATSKRVAKRIGTSASYVRHVKVGMRRRLQRFGFKPI